MKRNCFFAIWMQAQLKEWNHVKLKKHLNCAKLKCKWNVAKFEMQMKCCKIWNANVNLQRIWNKIEFETHWILQREKVFDSNEKGFALAKRSQGCGGWVSQKELTSCNFPSNFRNYSLYQMPSYGKLIAPQFRFRICMGLVLTKYFLCLLLVPY